MLRFEVEDADTDANGPPYTFDIVEGQPDHEFKVDGNGVLTTAARFNRDIKDQYDLVVRVYDNGSPSLFTDTTVITHVTYYPSDSYSPVLRLYKSYKLFILNFRRSIIDIFPHR